MPLVLHGGSRAGEEKHPQAVAGGINKINVCTDAFHAAKNAMLEKAGSQTERGLPGTVHDGGSAREAVCQDYIRVIGSNNQYFYGESVSTGNE